LKGGPSSLLAPTWQKLVDAHRIDDSAGKNMRADFPALFENDDRKLRIRLFQTDCRSKARRACADDHNVEFHAFAFGKLLICIFWGFRHSSLRPV